MLITRSGFKMFTDGDLMATLDNHFAQKEREILNDSFDCLHQDEYLEKKCEETMVEKITLKTDEVKAEITKTMVPAEYFPNSYNVHQGKSYEKPVAVFRLPFTGDENLLRLRPSTFISWTEEIEVEGKSIIFENLLFSEDAEKIKSERDGFIKQLQNQIENINAQVDTFNSQLKSRLEVVIKQKCAEDDSHSKLLDTLNS